MDAVLLAAGLGTRLKPLTDFLPKCLAPIKGRPLLEYWLRALFASGEIDRVLVNTHYHAELVEMYVRGSPWADRVVLVREKGLLGTGGTVVANAGFVGERPVIVAHADNLSLFDAAEFIGAHRARPQGSALTMMTFRTPDPSSCGVVALDERGLVQGFFEKLPNPPGDTANAAVYVFEPEVVRFMQRLGRPFVDISLDVLPKFLGRMSAWHNARYHRDIGTLESWRAAQKELPAPAPLPPAPDPWQQVLAACGPQAHSRILSLLDG